MTSTLSHMNLEEKVGQLFVVNGYGQSVQDPDPSMVALNQQYYGVDNIRQLIDKYHPGGIIYFGWTNNLQSPSQIVDLSNGIQQVSTSQQTPVPMLISTDQEQGEVLRIGPPATVFPGNMALGATQKPRLAYQAASITGAELRAMGVNVDNAPVVDVNTNPLNEADGIRSYSDRSGYVAAFGSAQVRGYQHQATGVAATAKHFPGLGDTTVNTDTGKAVSDQTLSQVISTNLPPFHAAVGAGVDQVMVGHVVLPNVDPSGLPASLSKPIVTGLLRDRVNYDGVAITDALDAAALSPFTSGQVALMALQAGDDELLEVAQTGVDNPPANMVAAYSAILNAVKTNTISQARLDQSVSRILRLKWELGLVKNPFTDPSQLNNVVGTPQHLAVANAAADSSITLLKNSAHVLPLTPNTGADVLVTGFGTQTTQTIANDIAARGLKPQVLATGSNPDQTAIANAVSAAKNNDLVVVTTFNAWSTGSQGQLALVPALIATGKPVIVAAVGTPYDVAYFPTASTFITNYDYQAVSHNALVRALFGEINPSGKLPVTITEPPPSQVVLYRFGYGLSY